jgi:hypothetical protein
VVDKKYSKYADLTDLYLTHSQDGDSRAAKITDILYEDILPQGIILDEINKRKDG